MLDISSVLDASHSTSWSPGHPGGPSCSLARMASTRARGPPSQSSSSFGPPRACLPSFRGRRAPGACCRRRPSRDGVCLSSQDFFIRNSILLGSNKVKVVFFRRTLIEALVEALELAASVDRRRKGLAHLLLSLRSSSKVTNTGPHGRTAQFSDTTMPWLRLRGTSRSFTHTESNRPLPALSRERDRERERRGGKIRGNSLVVGDQLPRRFFRRACRSSSMPSPTGSASAACGCCCCCCWGCATWVAGTLASWVLRLIPISSKTC